MTRKRYNVRLRLAATVVAAVLSLSGCTFQEMDRMSRKAQASGDIAREHVSEQMRSSQGALVWTDKPWVNLKPVPTVSRDTPLENFPDCQITLARDGLTLPEIGERITALCGVRVIFSPDALAVGQSSGTTRALNGPLPTPDNNGRIPLDQLGGAVDRAGVTATPLVLSGLRWQGKLSGLLDMIAARTGLTPRMDNGAILFSLLETRTFQFTFLNTNITSNASVTSGSTSSMGTSGGTTNSSVSGDSSSSQQTTVDQSRNVYDDMKKTLETMLTPQKGRFWLSASTGTLTVTDIDYLQYQLPVLFSCHSLKQIIHNHFVALSSLDITLFFTVIGFRISFPFQGNNLLHRQLNAPLSSVLSVIRSIRLSTSVNNLLSISSIQYNTASIRSSMATINPSTSNQR